MRVLRWTVVGVWAIATGFGVTDSWRTIAFVTGTGILVLEALSRHAFDKRARSNSNDYVDNGGAG